MAKRFKLSMPEPLEAQVLEAVLRYLDIEPRVTWGPYRCNVGKLARPGAGDAWAGWSITRSDRTPAVGFPDVICAVGGRLLCIETKRPSTGLTGAQPAFRDMCEAGGTIYAVVRSVDDAVEAVRGIPR